MCIPNSENRENFRKILVIIFSLAAFSLIIGFSIESLVSFIPTIEYGEPGYEEYVELIMNLGTLSTLFLNIGLGLFFMSTFIGAMTNRRVPIEIKKGMLIASGLGIIALVIFNYLGLIVYIM